MTRLRNLTPLQYRYLNDTIRFLLIFAGRRARKTLIGIWKDVQIAYFYANIRVICAAPTFKQAKKIFWDKLLSITKHAHSRKPDLTERIIYLRNGSIIELAGLDNPDKIEGNKLDHIHISEIPNCKEEVWKHHVRPMLADTESLGSAILDGTPEGRNFYYDMVLECCEGRIPKTRPIHGAYCGRTPSAPETAAYTWFSSDVLSPSEIEAIKRELDEQTFKQEMEGSFEDLFDIVYYAYSPDNHTTAEYYSNALETYLCFDFNVNPMTCVVNQKLNDGKWYAVKEFVHASSNTMRTGGLVRDWLVENGFPSYLGLTGDYSGNSSKTSARASVTDWTILKDIFPEHKKKRAIVTRSLKNRVNALNSKFKPMTGELKQLVNPKTCPQLDKGLNRLRIDAKANGFAFDTGGSVDHSHITDCLDYHALNIENPLMDRRIINVG